MSDVVRLPTTGAAIIIEPCPATQIGKIKSILDDNGMSELMPEPATALAALGPAMTENFPSPGGKVRHQLFAYENSSKGKKVGRHDKTEHLDVEERFCETVAIATLRMRNLPPEEDSKSKKPRQEWTGDISLSPYDPDKERDILRHMKHIQDYIPAGKLRKLIEDIVERLGGTRPFEGVPLLWLTPDVVPLFMPIKKAIEAASAENDHHGQPIEPTKIHVLSIVADEESARALISMLARQIDEEAQRAESRLAEYADSADKRGNDINRAMAVKDKLERMETLLDRPLTALKARARSLVVKIATGTMEKAELGA